MASLPAPVPAPLLNIPPSYSTVTLSIVDTTSTVRLSPSFVLEPPIEGHDELVCANYAFLIVHRGSDGNKKLLFDLGAKKSMDDYTPQVQGLTSFMQVFLDKDITEILGEETKEIDAAIWR